MQSTLRAIRLLVPVVADRFLFIHSSVGKQIRFIRPGFRETRDDNRFQQPHNPEMHKGKKNLTSK